MAHLPYPEWSLASRFIICRSLISLLSQFFLLASFYLLWCTGAINLSGFQLSPISFLQKEWSLSALMLWTARCLERMYVWMWLDCLYRVSCVLVTGDIKMGIFSWNGFELSGPQWQKFEFKVWWDLRASSNYKIQLHKLPLCSPTTTENPITKYSSC